MYDVKETGGGKVLARFAGAELAQEVADALPACEVNNVLCTEVDGLWFALNTDRRQIYYVADSHPLEEPVCPAGCVTDGNYTYPLQQDADGILAYFTLEHVDQGLLLANLRALCGK